MLRVVFLIFLGLAWAAPAGAQQVCANRDDLVTFLNTTYAERPVALGLAASGLLVEVLASDTGGWTLITTSPDGVACVRAFGESWTQLPAASESEDHPVS